MSLVLLADGLTRIRNGQIAGLQSARLRFSKFVHAVLQVMVKQGYIRSCELLEDGKFTYIDVKLSYYDGNAVINLIKMISKPGCKVYSSIKDLEKSFNGLGVKILSTPKGVMSDAEARELGVGGEVLCEIF